MLHRLEGVPPVEELTVSVNALHPSFVLCVQPFEVSVAEGIEGLPAVGRPRYDHGERSVGVLLQKFLTADFRDALDAGIITTILTVEDGSYHLREELAGLQRTVVALGEFHQLVPEYDGSDEDCKCYGKHKEQGKRFVT